jgi:hypothetical protein
LALFRINFSNSFTRSSFGAFFKADDPRRLDRYPFLPLPLVLTCADNDQFVMLSLRPGNVHAALGADDDLAYLVTRLRQVWPDVVLHFRGERRRRPIHPPARTGSQTKESGGGPEIPALLGLLNTLS